MLVRMLKTENGCPDGVKTRRYRAGKEYELPAELAGVFVDDMKVAERVAKAMPAAPANKSGPVVPRATFPGAGSSPAPMAGPNGGDNRQRPKLGLSGRRGR